MVYTCIIFFILLLNLVLYLYFIKLHILLTLLIPLIYLILVSNIIITNSLIYFVINSYWSYCILFIFIKAAVTYHYPMLLVVNVLFNLNLYYKISFYMLF